jgi:hypothetical protein
MTRLSSILMGSHSSSRAVWKTVYVTALYLREKEKADRSGGREWEERGRGRGGKEG